MEHGLSLYIPNSDHMVLGMDFCISVLYKLRLNGIQSWQHILVDMQVDYQYMLEDRSKLLDHLSLYIDY